MTGDLAAVWCAVIHAHAVADQGVEGKVALVFRLDLNNLPDLFAARSPPMPPCDSEQFRWFAEHLRPHESILRAWLRGYVSAADDLDDIVQEAYLRVLQARETCRIEAPRAFLFTTARNVALMRVRRRRTERIDDLAEREVENIHDQYPDVAETVARSQELNLLTEAIQSLPARCRQVLTLRKLYGLSQKETAAQLGIAEHTVEAQSTIALRKLADFFERIDGGRGKSHG